MHATARRTVASFATVASLAAACGSDAGDPAGVATVPTPPSPSTADALGSTTSPGSSTVCAVPAGVAADESVSGRRGEALVELLTGIDEVAVRAEDEGAEIEFDDPNYGGVWGDRAGGWVVAVVDCSVVDLGRVAALAGGSQSVRVIEVARSFAEVDDISDRLVDEIRRRGLRAEVRIDSTPDGRLIRVVVEDASLLDAGIGESVPADAFVIEIGSLDR